MLYQFQAKQTRKLNEIHEDTQVLSKAHLPNAIDIWSENIKKTSHTA